MFDCGFCFLSVDTSEGIPLSITYSQDVTVRVWMVKLNHANIMVQGPTVIEKGRIALKPMKNKGFEDRDLYGRFFFVLCTLAPY